MNTVENTREGFLVKLKRRIARLLPGSSQLTPKAAQQLAQWETLIRDPQVQKTINRAQDSRG